MPSKRLSLGAPPTKAVGTRRPRDGSVLLPSESILDLRRPESTELDLSEPEWQALQTSRRAAG